MIRKLGLSTHIHFAYLSCFTSRYYFFSGSLVVFYLYIVSLIFLFIPTLLTLYLLDIPATNSTTTEGDL
jgi:hypothetical protein